MFRSGAHFTILVLVIGLVLLREARQEPIRQLDESFADFLARNSRRTEEPAPITLIEINANSLKGHPWPWTPLDFALFFQAANNFQPEALATDELLRWDEKNGRPEAQSKLPQYKKILREHLLRARKVLLGAQLGFPDDPELIPVLEEVPLVRNVRGDVSGIPEFTTITSQAEEDFRLSSVTGFANLTENGHAHHSVPLLLRYRGQVVPSFVLQCLMIWEKLTPDDLQIEGGTAIRVADRFEIPIDSRGEMRIDFGVPRHRCGFDDLVLASAQADAHTPTNVPLDDLNGKLLLLARTDPAAQTLRFAAGRLGSAGELFAAAIATLQNRSFLHRAPVWTEFAMIALAMVAGWFAPRWSRSRVFVAAAVSVVIYVMFAMTIFSSSLTWLPIALPAGLVLFIAIYRLVSPAAVREN